MAGAKLTGGKIMTDENQDAPQSEQALQGEGAADEQQVQLRIEKIYLKDASFESPNSPEVFTRQWQPNLSVDINTRSAPLPDDRHEVVLTITVRANVEEEYLGFLVEVQQAGIFFVKNADPSQLSQVVGISCPTTLFPYARETISNLVNRGTFPPLNLAPVNFDAIFAAYVQKRAQQAQGEAPKMDA